MRHMSARDAKNGVNLLVRKAKEAPESEPINGYGWLDCRGTFGPRI